MLPVRDHFILPVSSKIYYSHAAMEDCTIEQLGVEQYLKGSRENYWEAGNPILALSSYEPLISTLDLALDLFVRKKTWVPIEPLFLEENEFGYVAEYQRTKKVSDSSNAQIIAHASRYGLLLKDVSDGRTYYNDIDPGRIEEIASLDCVADAFFDLFMLYLCWCYIEWGERGDYVKFIYQQIKWHSTDVMSPEAACRRLITREADRHLFSFRYEYDGTKMVTKMRANELHNALAYQLFDLLAAGEHAREGQIASICKQCGTQYIKKHGNASLCDICKTPQAKAKAYRERKKIERMGKSNA